MVCWWDEATLDAMLSSRRNITAIREKAPRLIFIISNHEATLAVAKGFTRPIDQPDRTRNEDWPFEKFDKECQRGELEVMRVEQQGEGFHCFFNDLRRGRIDWYVNPWAPFIIQETDTEAETSQWVAIEEQSATRGNATFRTVQRIPFATYSVEQRLTE
jgi:hypothetical protein